MQPKTIAYWILTALVALPMLASGAGYLSGAEPVLEALASLGYPAYFAIILGTWKVLGAIALLAPVPERLKEWAYAGFFFTLSGAVASHAASGDGIGGIAPPAIVGAMLIGSYLLRPARESEATSTAAALAS